MQRVFPSRSDYEIAIQHLDKFACQADLKRARVMMQANGSFPKVYSGGRAVVFPVLMNGSKYALKCWIQSLGDLPIRYQKINRFANEKKPSFLIDSEYLDAELLVNGSRYPALRMEWSDSLTLKDWIAVNIADSSALSALAYSFLDLCQEMHELQFSHGDLQHENILVNGENKLVLVDYDSVFIPGLEDLSDEIKGLPGYQHKSRADLRFSRPYVDYLSEYVIYISLVALSVRPDLWSQIKDHNRILFSEEDINMPSSSPMIKDLGSILDVKTFLDAFIGNCACSSIEQMLPLDQAIPLKSRPPSKVRSPKSNPHQSGTHPSPHDTKVQDSHPQQTWQPNGSASSQDPWSFTSRTSNQPPSSDAAEVGSTASPQPPNSERVLEDLRDSMLWTPVTHTSSATPRSAQSDTIKPGRKEPADSATSRPMGSGQVSSGNSQIPADVARPFSYKTKSDICTCTCKSDADVQRAINTLGCREPFTLVEADRLAAILTGDPFIKKAFERNISRIAATTPPPAPASSGGVVPKRLENQPESDKIQQKSDCFVATALYGSSTHPDVVALREFRDSVLMSSRPGKSFVYAYYRVGPRLAKFILRCHLGFLRMPLSWVVRFLISR